MRLRRLLPLLTGFALGGAGACAVRLASAGRFRIEPGSAAAAPAALPASGPGRSASLLLPHRLEGAEADSALDAWLALPPLADKAPAAEIAARLIRLRALLTLLPTDRFDRLLAALVLRGGAAEARIRRAAFDVWTERNASVAARWAAALVPGEIVNARTRDRYASAAVLAWADSAFDEAYAWAITLGDARLGQDLARQLLARLVVADPTRALELARAVGEEFFEASRHTLFRAWAAKDPGAAVQALGAAILEREKSAWPVRRAIARWLAREPQRAFDWIAAQPARDNDPYGGLLVSLSSDLSREDPSAVATVASLLLAQPGVSGRSSGLNQLVGSWVHQDPKAALAWLEKLPDVEKRTELIEYSFNGLELDDLVAFARYLPEGKTRSGQIAGYLSSLAQIEPDKVLAWLAAHDSPEFAPVASRVQGTLIANLARTDPAAALARWEGLPDAADKASALGPFALAWARTDPAAAARWLAPLVSGTAPPGSRKAFQAATARLALSDPQGLIKLAETLPDPALRENTYQTLASDGFYEENGSHASATMSRSARADLLAAIPDETLRTPALKNLLTTWLHRDFQSARSWIEGHDALSPELAAQLISQADPTTPLTPSR